MSNERNHFTTERSGVSRSSPERVDFVGSAAPGPLARVPSGFAALVSPGLLSLGLLLPCLLIMGGCQAPEGPSQFAYGDAPLCEDDGEHQEPIALRDGLGALRAAFDESLDAPRMIVLMPHMGCERGAEILRDHVLDAFPTKELALFVVWQDEARTGGAAAASRASTYLRDPRVQTFHDCSGIAGRAFARGNLPIAEAREVFLFYPAGITWPSDGSRPTSARPVAQDQAPQTESWVHQLGRVVPERFCTPEELPTAIGDTVRKLIEDAEERREILAAEDRIAAAP